MKKVAIIGYASNWKEAPFNDSDCEIWVPNIAEVVKPGFPRFNRVFDVHLWNVIEEEAKADPAGMKYVIDNNVPTYLIEKKEIIPSSITYPLDEVTKLFFPWAIKIANNKYEDAYWTSSSQFMLALAIYEGFEEIGIYGIDMADSSEYRSQRRGCEYMLGYAMGKGIKVNRTQSTPVLRRKFIYGYETAEEQAYREYIKTRAEHLRARISEVNNRGIVLAAEKNHLEGALHVYTDIVENWYDA